MRYLQYAVFINILNFFVLLYCEIIFSILSVFKGMNQRNGTDMDAGNAMQVFKKLGYKVHVYNDQSIDQIKQVLSAGK